MEAGNPATSLMSLIILCIKSSVLYIKFEIVQYGHNTVYGYSKLQKQTNKSIFIYNRHCIINLASEIYENQEVSKTVNLTPYEIYICLNYASTVVVVHY